METNKVSQNQEGWPGLIPRNDLVALCRAELPRLSKENAELAESIDLFERQHGDHTHTIQSLNYGLAENIGFQKALRFVCEWAANHIVEPSPIPDAEDEIANYKEQLKERFNG